MNQNFDINVLCEEATIRWLKPSEVYYVLLNHEKFPITSQPPQRPPSGSLFLYNRRVNRFFRKDGHSWRRKRDGRTVGEAHERLKVGNVDALSCYYAHGEHNPSFQRRSFWMLHPAYEHIVLVHYREVAEGRYISGSSSTLPTVSSSALRHPSSSPESQHQGSAVDTSELSESYQSPSSLSSLGEVSSFPPIQEFMNGRGAVTDGPGFNQATSDTMTEVFQTISSNSEDKPEFNVALKKIQEQLSLDEDDDYIYYEQKQPSGSNVEKAGMQGNVTSTLPMVVSGDNQTKQFQAQGTHGLSRKISPSWKDVFEANLVSPKTFSYQASKLGPQSDIYCGQNSENPLSNDLQLKLSETERFLLSSENFVDSSSLSPILREAGDGAGIFSEPLPVEDNRYLPHVSIDHNQFAHLLEPDTSVTLAQRQRFTIREISPEWAFSNEKTKVIITGDFLCDPSNCCWHVMFGDAEVPAEIVQQGVLRCHTPLHSEGKLIVCITSGNRESCSEVREFEFCAKATVPSLTEATSSSSAPKTSEELLCVAKFVQMLLLEHESAPTNDPWIGQHEKLNMDEEHWQQLIDGLHGGCQNPSGTQTWIMEEVLKNKFQQWISSKHQRNQVTGGSLSKEEQGILHLISALGYKWALSPLLGAGVGINFRDVKGWTALHWAAYFGREEMVAELLAEGASATAVTDPTPHDAFGKRAAYLASKSGYKGLAGYLSETALTSHLESLNIEENEISKGSAALEAERAVESISQRSGQLHGGTEDELCLKESLAAVRNAAQAAARIQNAFRAYSFRKRLQRDAEIQDEYGMTQQEIDELAAIAHYHHRASNNQFGDNAALSIQKNYRGYKGRKKFLTLRGHVVRIQAHVRGHQVRKKYRFVRAVSVLEKVILRWRRKGAGLRGFKAEKPEMVEEHIHEPEDDEEDDDEEVIKLFRRQKVDEPIKAAVSRVLSMVDSPEARQQYRRMLQRFHKATAEHSISDEATSSLSNDLEFLEADSFIS